MSEPCTRDGRSSECLSEYGEEIPGNLTLYENLGLRAYRRDENLTPIFELPDRSLIANINLAEVAPLSRAIERAEVWAWRTTYGVDELTARIAAWCKQGSEILPQESPVRRTFIKCGYSDELIRWVTLNIRRHCSEAERRLIVTVNASRAELKSRKITEIAKKEELEKQEPRAVEGAAPHGYSFWVVPTGLSIGLNIRTIGSYLTAMRLRGSFGGTRSKSRVYCGSQRHLSMRCWTEPRRIKLRKYHLIDSSRVLGADHMIRYRLDELGWRQFEELIQLLLKQHLSVAVQAWGGHRDNGRDAFSRGRLRFPDKDNLSEGPFLFQAKFVEEANAAGAQPNAALISAVRKEGERIEERLRVSGVLGADWRAIRHYVLLTNVALSPTIRLQIEEILGSVLPACAIHTMGAHDICTLIDSHPNAKRAFPQLLSLRDFNLLLEEAVNKDVLERSRSAVEEAKDLLPVFVPTEAYSGAFKVVRRHHFVVLEGPPEMGKTAIARILGLVQLFAGWDMIECRTPEDFFNLFNGERPQVFIADDAFGHTEYEPDRVRAWEHDLPKIIGRLDSRHWLLWTSRRHILERARRSMDLQGKAENFPQPAEVVVDASALSIEEKALILYRHARAATLDPKLKAVVRENVAAFK